MIVVNWKGKIGYGDIVSPICYAHNLAYRLDTKVKLIFHWEKDRNHKYHPDDPETLHERADYIAQQCVKQDVVVDHKFNSPLPKNFNHDNYEFVDGLHNYWYCAQPNIIQTDEVVVGGSQTNLHSLQDYGKSWKDPMGPTMWKEMVTVLKSKHNVVEVGYRTPIADLFAVMRRAKFFLGYHGSVAWVARFTNIPMLLWSTNPKLTGKSLNYPAVKTSFDMTVANSISSYRNYSLKTLAKTHADFASYKFPESLTKSLVWT